LIEIPEIDQIWLGIQEEENILLHIKDLMDSPPPLLNLLIEEEESRSMNSQDEPMCPFERWFMNT
jgi:hypothetical protein